MNNYQIFDTADQVTQDILILGATKDHFINYRTVGQEINAFTKARSISVRIFTEQEYGEAHCNVGNTGLVCDTILNWISFTDNWK